MPKRRKNGKFLNFIAEDAEKRIQEADGWVDGLNAFVANKREEDEERVHVSLLIDFHYGVEMSFPKSCDWRNEKLWNMNDYSFLELLHVTKNQFSCLVSLLTKDTEFVNSDIIHQFTTEQQLAIVLYRLGTYGEEASIRKLAYFFGVCDYSTVDEITIIVFNAFLRMQSQFIYWPDQTEREEIIVETFNELPNCIGYVDGTELKLAEPPADDHLLYCSKKGYYAVKAQIVCDYKLKIRHFVVGHVGSWDDAMVYKTTSLYKQEEEFFASYQYIAGDGAYPLTGTVITPYSSTSEQLDAIKRKEFNWYHGKYRVRAEHCLGILKEKFSSLKELRIRIHNDASRKFCCDWFRVCCILHNILITDGDLELFCSDYDFEAENTAEAFADIKNDEYEVKREAVYQMMFN